MEIEPSKENISNKLVNALLEAIFDVLDADGKLSIIRFAKLDYMKEPLPSNGFTKYEDFIKLVTSMNFLLSYSKTVMYEIGRKFSFYLSPFGTSLQNFLKIIENSLFNNIKIHVNQISENLLEIILSKCPFCEGMVKYMPNVLEQDFSCDFIKGIISETIKKSSDKSIDLEIEHTRKGLCECRFEIFLDNNLS